MTNPIPTFDLALTRAEGTATLDAIHEAMDAYAVARDEGLDTRYTPDEYRRLASAADTLTRALYGEEPPEVSPSASEAQGGPEAPGAPASSEGVPPEAGETGSDAYTIRAMADGMLLWGPVAFTEEQENIVHAVFDLTCDHYRRTDRVGFDAEVTVQMFDTEGTVLAERTITGSEEVR